MQALSGTGRFSKIAGNDARYSNLRLRVFLVGAVYLAGLWGIYGHCYSQSLSLGFFVGSRSRCSSPASGRGAGDGERSERRTMRVRARHPGGTVVEPRQVSFQRRPLRSGQPDGLPSPRRTGSRRTDPTAPSAALAWTSVRSSAVRPGLRFPRKAAVPASGPVHWRFHRSSLGVLSPRPEPCLGVLQCRTPCSGSWRASGGRRACGGILVCACNRVEGFGVEIYPMSGIECRVPRQRRGPRKRKPLSPVVCKRADHHWGSDLQSTGHHSCAATIGGTSRPLPPNRYLQ